MKRLIPLMLVAVACQQATTYSSETAEVSDTQEMQVVQPVYVSDPVPHDSDDPAIWINPDDPAKSLIVGTDKAGPDGGLYVFNLKGKLVDSVSNLNRPNNVDIAYGMAAGEDTFSIAVCSERLNGQLRAFRLPEMTPVDDGGMPVFEGEENRAVMGIALYQRPQDGAIFAIVSRKTEEGDPADSAALWQYRLSGRDDGNLTATLVRRFGYFSGRKEIEAIAVDHSQGYVFYSDEQMGVRQYYADPDLGDDSELAFFATDGFAEDHEGIAIYPTSADSGFLTVSDQGAQQFHVFERIGTEHPLLRVVKVAAVESDGSEATFISLNADFPRGLFVAMSDDRTFHLYDVRDILPLE